MTLTVPTGPRTLVLRASPIDEVPPPPLPSKDPANDCTYGVDFARVIQATATIEQIAVDVVPVGAVSVRQATWIGTVVVMHLSGGVDQSSAQIAVTVITTDNQIIRRGVSLAVIAQVGVPALDADAITLNEQELDYAGWTLPPAGTS